MRQPTRSDMKKLWSDKNRRKGIIGTVLFHIVLLVLFLMFGLKYTEPKPEDGIVINFGNSETGFGHQDDGAPTTQTPTPAKPQTETQETQAQDDNPIQTQDAVEAPSVESQKTSQTKKVDEPEVKEPEKPKPSSELEKMLQNVKSSKTGGEGDKKGAGDQGRADGDKKSHNRVGGGQGGNGGGGNYQLGGRMAMAKPLPEYNCTDEGRVVVKIYVDRNGKVTSAFPGDRIPNGAKTTTASKCLFNKAKAAALKTTWQADADAPSLQVGYIVYYFEKN